MIKLSRLNFWQILRRTIKSLNRKEELLVTLLVISALVSGYFSYQNVAYSLGLGLGKARATFSEGIVGEIRRLNPVFVELNSVDRDISSLIFAGLAKYDPKTKSFQDDLATHTLSPDKKTYTFKIRPDALWHDQTLLTAQDVYFTYHDVIQHPDFQNPVLKNNFKKVQIKLLDNAKIQFTLENPNSFFFSNLTVGILPMHILKDRVISDLAKDDFSQFPIGSGPYKVKEPFKTLDKGSTQVILERFDDYFGQKPSLREIKITTYLDFETLLKAKNVLDGVARISTEEVLQVFREDARFAINKYTLPRYSALFFNLDAAFLSDRRVRLALAKSIDKDSLINELPGKKRIDTPLLELNQDDWIHKSNITEAKGSLFDAGWRLNSDGSQIRKNNKGQELKLKILVLEFSNNREKADEINKVIKFLTENWREIGIDLEINKLNESEFQLAVLNREYDVLFYGEDLGYNLDTFSYWHSTQKGKSGLNLSNYANPRADALIESIRILFDSENDKKKRQKLMALQQQISTDVPAVVLFTQWYYYAVDSRIANLAIGNLRYPADRFNNIAEWEFGE